jgi:hypothetical protein
VLIAVIVLAVAALVSDPVSHLSSEGSGQWFVSRWPL